MKEISLKILDQKGVPACAAYAVAGLANYYLEQKGIEDEIDALALFNNCERGGIGTNIMKCLQYGKDKGFTSLKGSKYYVREFSPVAKSISEIERNIDQHGGLVCAYALHDKDSFNSRLDSKFVLSREPWDVHAMVMVGYDRVIKRLKLANSWGSRWGANGYFFMPYVLARPEYLKQVFWFSLK